MVMDRVDKNTRKDEHSCRRIGGKEQQAAGGRLGVLVKVKRSVKCDLQ